jgi:hypothetical protein
MRKTVLSAMIAAMVVCGGCIFPPDNGPDNESVVVRTNDHQVATGIVKRALCVGMRNSEYAGPCPGADVDAEVAAILFSEHSFLVTSLADRECTREAAMDALRDQIAGAGPGSLIAIYWSGHGGQQEDRNGDEADGMDETLCTWDGPLVDDDIARICDTIPAGVRVFAVFDTCNSGTMARKALRDPRVANRQGFRASMIVFAGCADGKSSFGDSQGGLWTTALIDAYTNGITYRAWFDSAVKKMSPTVDQLPKWTEYGNCTEFANSPALE